MGIGHSSEKTDRANELSGMAGLKSIFNYGMNAGSSLIGAGTSGVNAATGYLKNILSGNRNAVTAAVAPQANQVRAASDAAKRQTDTLGTARGGGVASTNEMRDSATQGKIDEAILGERSKAAGALGNLSLGEVGAGTNIAGMGANAETSMTDISAKSRVDSAAINQQMQQNVGAGIQAIFGLGADLAA